jgi:hypothetical protein
MYLLFTERLLLGFDLAAAPLWQAQKIDGLESLAIEFV